MFYHLFKNLPHLENVFSSTKNSIDVSIQSIALEGWRRSLNLTFYRDSKNSIKYSLSNDEKTHHFLSSKETSSDSNKNIEKTKRLLSNNKIAIPEGSVFEPGISNEELISYAKKIGFPIVLKIVNAPKKTFLNIQSSKELKSILIKHKKRLTSRKLMIEKFIDGDELHFFIIENEILSVLQKKPIIINGNGKDSIDNLIKRLNKDRELKSSLNTKLIKVNKRVKNILSKQDYTINSVPKQNEQVYLQRISDQSRKGDSVNVTDQVTNHLKDIALQAGNTSTSAPYYEIKMIADLKVDIGVVLSINTKPNVTDYLLPTEGDPVDIPKKIVDYYFPETKHFNRSNFYFDFEKINELLNSHSAESIKVTNCPTNQFFAKLYVVSGRVQKVSYRKWIAKKAKKHNLYGYTRNLNDGDVEVLVAGKKNIVNDFKQICLKGPKKAKVKNIKEINWEKPIEIGFEIKSTKKVTKSK